MTEERFRELLEETAAGIARDVAGDFPEMDTGHEVYVRELDGQLVGLVYMGDCGSWAYGVDPSDPDKLEDRFDIHDRVKRLTPYSDEVDWERQSWRQATT